MSETAGVLKEILVSSGDGDRVTQTALIAGVSKDAVYAQSNSKCNPSAEVIGAAFVVTGDERLKRKLTPPGYKLVRCEETITPTKSLEEEINDVLPDLGAWIAAIRDPNTDPGEADTLKMKVDKEIAEAHAKFRMDAQDRGRKLTAVSD